MRSDVAPQVVVNGRFLARRVTGVERYGWEILRCIGESLRLESTSAQGWPGHAWEQFMLPTKLNRNAVLWSPANTGPLMIRRQALTIHDLSPLEHPEWFHASFSSWYRLLLPILAKRVQRVFTPSEYVKQKVMRQFGIRQVIVTPNGVDTSVFHPRAQLTRSDLPRNYVLFVGTLEPRKNLECLLQAWKEIKDQLNEMWLLIVGVPGNVFKKIHVSRDSERVRFLGYVGDETLAGLYANASLFVLPSRDEGFGLPALEAMASGTPVLVSNGGALPEVVGKAGLIFKLQDTGTEFESRRHEDTGIAAPQADVSALANAMKACLSDPRLRAELREKGLEHAQTFSWQTTAELIWRALHEI